MRRMNRALETLGILEKWSLRRGGCLREVVATGGSTVYPTRQPLQATL